VVVAAAVALVETVLATMAASVLIATYTTLDEMDMDTVVTVVQASIIWLCRRYCIVWYRVP